MGLLSYQAKGPQLYFNPGCNLSQLLNGRQTTSTSRYASNLDTVFCSIVSIFPHAGNFRLEIDYSASGGPLRVVRGGADHCDLPESTGGTATIDIAASGSDDFLTFSDLGNAECAITRINIYEVFSG